jgi:hypothetical protein
MDMVFVFSILHVILLFCCHLNILIAYCSEYCAPVVVTLTTLEAENVCLKNGLLFHELLRLFLTKRNIIQLSH